MNAICDYVLIIDKGTLVAEDTPEHLSEDFSDTDNINMSVKGSREQVEEVLKVSEYIRDYKIIDEKMESLMYRQKQRQKKISAIICSLSLRKRNYLLLRWNVKACLLKMYS